MPRVRSRKTPARRSTSNPRNAAWAVALDAARHCVGDFLDPNRGEIPDLDEALDEVVAAVRAQTGPRPGDAPGDREMYEQGIGREAGYLFGLAVASIMRGPWDGLDLGSWAPNALVPSTAGGAR